MRTLRSWIVRLFNLFNKDHRERELADEMEANLEFQIEDGIRAGMTPQQARRAALIKFGSLDAAKEAVRDRRGIPFLETFLRDVSYALRMMRRNKGWSAVAILSLALGIGANTAIFSVIDGLILRMLPVRDPAQLVRVEGTVYSDFLRTTLPIDRFPRSVYEHFRDHNAVFTEMFAFSDLDRPELSVGGQTEGSGGVELVSGSFFSALGVGVALGRGIDTDLESPAAVISYGYWKRRFALDPSIIGKKISVNNIALDIIGVAQPRFFGVSRDSAPDLWVPLAMRSQLTGEPVNSADDLVSLMARLKLGENTQHAAAALTVLYTQVPQGMRFYKGNSKAATMEVLPGGRGYSTLRDQFSQPLEILMIVVALVLVTACANVASLLLARATARRKEIITRLAIGAGRARLIRQLLTESLLLATAGGVAGLALAMWGKSALLELLPASPAPLVIQLDARILGFNAAATLLTAILFGLVPAFCATRVDLAAGMGRIETTTRSGLRLNKILVVSQVALSLFLLTAAGLFLGSLEKLKSVDPGFNPKNLVQISIDTSRAGYRGPQVAALYRQLLEQLEAIPGVRAVSGVRNGIIQNGVTKTSIVVPHNTAPSSDADTVDSADVGPRFFETASLPLISGRDFSAADDTQSPKVVVINEALARLYFPGQNPVGKHLSTGPGSMYEIVGISKDAKIVTLRRNVGPMLYFPALQGHTDRVSAIEIRTSGDPSSVVAAARQEVLRINNRLLVSIKTMNEQIDTTLVQERMIGTLSGFFGALALVLASIGLYGLMAYSVARRTREIGVRMALGADRHNMRWMVLRETLILGAVGITIGIPATLVGARLTGHWIEGLLFQISAADPVTIAMAALLLLGVAAIAGYLPARRASRLEPMIALRYE